MVGLRLCHPPIGLRECHPRAEMVWEHVTPRVTTRCWSEIMSPRYDRQISGVDKGREPESVGAGIGAMEEDEQIAAALGLSVRQVQRLKKALREEGPVGLAHGNRGSEAAHGLPKDVAARVLELYETKYTGFNFSHFHEKLLEVEGIQVSSSTVGRVLRRAGHRSPKKRRRARHRSRRERRACEGAMLQLDGSPHDWLEGRGPRMCLLVE